MWHLYILRCRDNSLYTGVTVDVSRRLKQHNSGKGSRAIRGKLPAEVVYQERYRSQSKALKREAQIKKLARAEKLMLVSKLSSK